MTYNIPDAILGYSSKQNKTPAFIGAHILEGETDINKINTIKCRVKQK